MISWRLWQTLKYPPENDPLYQHALEAHIHTVSVPIHKRKTDDQPSDEFPFHPARSQRLVAAQIGSSSRNTVYRVLAVLAFSVFCCCGSGGFFLVPLALLLVSTGTFYGLSIAVRISGQIAEEHNRGRYELLSLTPSGALGFSWSVVTGYLYRNGTFSRLRRWMAILTVILALFGSGSLLFQAMLVVSTPSYQETFNAYGAQWLWLVYALTTATAFYIDFYQSVVVGVLLAVITPTYDRNRFETQALTVGGFLSVQIVTYLTTLLVGFVVLPAVYQALDIGGWFAEWSLVALRLGTFVLTREALIAWLWQFAQQRLNIGMDEFDQLILGPKREVPAV